MLHMETFRNCMYVCHYGQIYKTAETIVRNNQIENQLILYIRDEITTY